MLDAWLDVTDEQHSVDWIVTWTFGFCIISSIFAKFLELKFSLIEVWMSSKVIGFAACEAETGTCDPFEF